MAIIYSCVNCMLRQKNAQNLEATKRITVECN